MAAGARVPGPPAPHRDHDPGGGGGGAEGEGGEGAEGAEEEGGGGIVRDPADREKQGFVRFCSHPNPHLYKPL